MKVCLYFENYENIKQSGVGKAMQHQIAALNANGIEYTLDPNDDYDILHINTVFLRSASVINKARKKGAKIIYHAHSTPEDSRNSFMFSNLVSGFVKWHLLHVYKKADYLLTPTPYSKRLLEGHGITQPITAISNGIDLTRFSKNEEKAKKFRDYFGIKEGEKVIVSAGLWIKRKGILDFVKVAEQMPDVKFIWFGYTNPKLIPKAVRDVVLKNHPENCIFPGYMSGDVFEGAFSADAFFFPSLEETEGIVILEALASKTLVITRDIPVYEGWMQNNVNCYKGKTVDDFVNALKLALVTDNTEIIESGHQTAVERSLPNIGKRLGEIYNMVYNGEY